MTLRNVNEIKNEVADALRELASLAGESGAASLHERILVDRLPRLEEERAVLVVLGEFNHGKTTFVNALLGGPVLPTGITPTTAMIHEVRHGDTARAVLVRRPADAGATSRPLTGPREEVAFSQLGDLVAGGRARPEDVLRVEIEYPAELLRDRVTLVDTPGVNDLNHQRAEITYGYVPRADGVVFLLDAGQILKESERRFLRDRLLGAGRDRIVFAINKADLLSPGERTEVMEYATRQLSSLVPGAPVMFLSATRALAGDRAGSGLDALLAKLSSLLGNDRLKMLVDYAADEGLRVSEILGRGLSARRRALTMTSEEFDRRLKALEGDVEQARTLVDQRRSKIDEEIAAIKAVAQRDLEAFTNEFASAIRLEVEKSSADDIRKFLPGFMEETWRKWLETEAKTLGERLEALGELHRGDRQRGRPRRRALARLLRGRRAGAVRREGRHDEVRRRGVRRRGARRGGDGRGQPRGGRPGDRRGAGAGDALQGLGRQGDQGARPRGRPGRGAGERGEDRPGAPVDRRGLRPEAHGLRHRRERGAPTGGAGGAGRHAQGARRGQGGRGPVHGHGGRDGAAAARPQGPPRAPPRPGVGAVRRRHRRHPDGHRERVASPATSPLVATPRTTSLRAFSLVLAALCAANVVPRAGRFSGDAMIHLSIAEGAASGRWFEFNPGEVTSATTSPAWTALEAALLSLGGYRLALPAVSLVTLAALAGAALLVRRMALRLGASQPAASVGALLFASLPGVASNAPLGMENVVFAFASLAFLLAITTPGRLRRPLHAAALGALLGLCVLLRPEGALLSVAVAAALASPESAGPRRRWASRP